MRRRAVVGLQRGGSPWMGAIGLALVLVFAGALPAQRWMASAREAHREARLLLSRVAALPEPASRMPEGLVDMPPLIAEVNRSASAAGLAFAEFRPEGESRLRLALRDGDFDALLRWLAQLGRQHAVQVVSMDVRPTEAAGRVDATLVLERGAPGAAAVSAPPAGLRSRRSDH